MEQLITRANALKKEINEAVAKLNIKQLEQQRAELRGQMEASDFWADNQKAQAISKKEADLSRKIDPWLALNSSVSEAAELAALDDQSIEKDILSQLHQVEESFSALKKDLQFQGPEYSRRCWRYRCPGLGANAATHVYPLGRGSQS
jgi:hypothetical protein